MCNHELKRLFYTSDDNYNIQTCRVELEGNDEKHTLSYCEKCGQVFVMEIAEKDKIRVGDEVVYHGDKYVVGYVGADEVYHIVDRNWIRVVVQGDYQIFKTGRHFPEVAELLKKMGEEIE